MNFRQLTEEFARSHTSTLSIKSQRNHRIFMTNLHAFFGERRLTAINQQMVEEYRDYRRQQPLKWHPERITKGATVNRELEWLAMHVPVRG